MTPIEDQAFENQTLIMDGKLFLRCRFENCSLIYTGGEFGWTDCHFGVNVFHLKGAAQKTVKSFRQPG